MNINLFAQQDHIYSSEHQQIEWDCEWCHFGNAPSHLGNTVNTDAFTSKPVVATIESTNSLYIPIYIPFLRPIAQAPPASI